MTSPTEPWGVEAWDGTLIQCSTGYCIQSPPQGIYTNSHRTLDVPRGDRPGDVSGYEMVASRSLFFPWIVNGNPPSSHFDPHGRFVNAEARARVVRRLFSPAYPQSAVERPITVKIPGFAMGADLTPAPSELATFFGRYRSVVEEPQYQFGYHRMLAQFQATDPFKYGPETDLFSELGGDALFVDADQPSDRVTVTITGNGGIPVIEHVEDDNAVIAFSGALGVGVEAVLDMRAQTATISGIEVPGLLAAGPQFFRVLPGTNTLNLSGAASIWITYRPAYL